MIYTAPIEALSNTKLHDLRQNYSDISFGIITGDITDNPEADVLVMTTEILPMTLIHPLIPHVENAPLAFEMDVENDLAAVVFDTTSVSRSINQSIVLETWGQANVWLPPQVQLIMLSATIDKLEVFAHWVERQLGTFSLSTRQDSECTRTTYIKLRVWSVTRFGMYPAGKVTPKSQR